MGNVLIPEIAGQRAAANRRQGSIQPTQRAKRAMGLLVASLLLVMLAGCGSTSVHFIEPSLAANTQNAPTPTLAAVLPPFHTYTNHLPTMPTLTANAAFLFNPATDDIYLASNADEEVAMASTTKIMTAYVALSFGRLDQRITIGADADGLTLQAEYGASVAYLRTGDVLTLRDLLYGLLLPSGDDAAIAIADGVAGSQQNFVALMNLEAGLLDMRHTHYSDVHGLDATGHHTTARDLARLAVAAMENSTFAQIVQTTHYTLPKATEHGDYSWTTTNNLLLSNMQVYYPTAIGIKTGYTGNAGGCLVFAAKRSYGELIGVVLGEPGDTPTADALRFTDAVTLLNWGFGIEQSLPNANAAATPTATP